MIKYVSVLLAFVVYIFCSAHKEGRCCTTLIIDPDYKSKIELWDKPGGKLLKSLRHDFSNEDYVTVDILGKNDSMYYVEANYSINGKIGKGWIKRNNVAFGVYSRAYSGNLKLYHSPKTSSKIHAKVKEYTPKLYRVLDIQDGWLLVQIELSGKKYKGWMEPAMQCANPYSTCN